MSESLRESIRRCFPAETYSGNITLNDSKLVDGVNDWNAILDEGLDDDKELYDVLKGRSWTEVPAQLLEHQPSGYNLLTDEALPAFLPAWLMHSLDCINKENEVRDFAVYSFTSTMQQFRVLNPDQQNTVRAILLEFTERGTSKYVANLAREAVALIDRGRYWLAAANWRLHSSSRSGGI